MDFQQRLIDSSKKQGGYGRKVAHFMLRGISDVLLAHPGFTLMQWECKDFGAVAPGFNRKTGATHHQVEHLRRLHAGSEGTIGGLAIRTMHRGIERVSFIPYDSERFSEENLFDCPSCVWSVASNQYLKLTEAFDAFGVSRI